MGIMLFWQIPPPNAKRQTFEGFCASLTSGEWMKYIPPNFTV